jgi:hypothetical protein
VDAVGDLVRLGAAAWVWRTFLSGGFEVSVILLVPVLILVLEMLV